jgi:type VI secretion system protein ImpB
MANESTQKWISRNRAPRVHIEYDVELEGAQRKVDLPFVMGVLADLSGNPAQELPDVAQRSFLEIDVDNFDERMKASAPRVAVTVPNTLTGEGNLAVDLTFTSLDDFSPASIARKIEPLRVILEQRQALENLKARIDGKAKVETELAKLLGDKPALEAKATKPAA